MTDEYLSGRIKDVELAIAEILERDLSLSLMLRLDPGSLPPGISAVLLSLDRHPLMGRRQPNETVGGNG